MTDDLCRKVIEQTLQEIDNGIRRMPARKRNWYVERKDDPKTLTTSVGEVSFFKTLYTSKNEVDENGKPISCYLIDKILGLAPNQTMTEDAVARVYEEAVQTSYRKGGITASPDGISKGTIKNILHDIKFPPSFRIPMVKKEGVVGCSAETMRGTLSIQTRKKLHFQLLTNIKKWEEVQSAHRILQLLECKNIRL